MSENEFILLCSLMGNGDGDEPCDSLITAVTVEEIVGICNEPSLSSPSTVYKNLKKLVERGLVSNEGLKKGRCYTYYITEAGKNYVNRV